MSIPRYRSIVEKELLKYTRVAELLHIVHEFQLFGSLSNPLPQRTIVTVYFALLAIFWSDSSMKLFLYFLTSNAVLLRVVLAGANSACSGVLNDIERCFLGAPATASAYCSSYLSVPIITVTFTPSA